MLCNLEEPVIYEYLYPYIKSLYNKQQENSKKSSFFFNKTFEIYNYIYQCWDVYTPDLINYSRYNLKDKDIKRSVYYVIKYKKNLQDIYNNSYYILLLLLFEENGISFHSLFFIILYKLFVSSNNNKYSFISYYLGITPNKMRWLYVLIMTFLFQTHNFTHEFNLFPFLLFLDSTNNYIDIKKNNKTIKPFYVAFMWIMAILIMPAVIHEHNYDILQYPTDYLSPFLLIFGLSNYVDIKDMEEDKLNKIDTIPVVYGKDFSLFISYASFFTSFLLYF